jgi:hypothetical protein
MATTLWTDLIDPIEATAIARVEQQQLEDARGQTLARFLPNSPLNGDIAEFVVGQYGLVDEAKYRAWGAPPELGKGGPISTGLIKLQPMARSEVIDEQTQKDLAQLSDDTVRKSVANAIRRNVQAIVARTERSRATLIETGNLVVDQDNILINDLYGRDAALTYTLGTLWSSANTVDRITPLRTAVDTYASKNNYALPGVILMSRAVWASLTLGTQFATVLPGGATQPAQADAVRQLLASYDLPPIELFDKRTSVNGTATPLLDATKIYLLPAPVATAEQALLGVTYVGRTVTSQKADWGIPQSEQPGIVSAVFDGQQVGDSIEAQADACILPALWNANASAAIKVIA